MPTFLHTANGVKTVFKCLTSPLPKRVRVDGRVVTPQSSTDTSVTLNPAPIPGVDVEIMYGEIRTVVDRSPGTPLHRADGAAQTFDPVKGLYGMFPDATTVNTAQSIAPPVVSFHGDTAENVVFVLDPNAVDVDVYPNGRIAFSRR